GNAWVDVAGLLSNLANLTFNTSTAIVTHHTGAAGSPNVDTPLSDAELNAGDFAGKFYISAYGLDNLVPKLPAFDPNSLNPQAGLNGFLDTLRNILDGPVLGPNLPLIGDKIKSALTLVDDIRAAVNALQANSTPDQIKAVFQD